MLLETIEINFMNSFVYSIVYSTACLKVVNIVKQHMILKSSIQDFF